MGADRAAAAAPAKAAEAGGGPPRGLNAMRYLARSGAAGACCPTTSRRGRRCTGGSAASCGCLLFQTIHDIALMIDRERAGREASPSGGVLDSQTVKAPAARERGYDAGQEDRRAQAAHRGRHRRASADGQSHHRRHLRQCRAQTYHRRPSASAGPGSSTCSPTAPMTGRKLMDKAAYLDFVIEIVRRIDGPEGLPGTAPALGGRTHLRLDDPMAPPGPRLRAAHRRLRGHDPRRHGKPPPPAASATEPVFKRDSKSCRLENGW